MLDCESAWSDCLSIIKQKVGLDNYEKWFVPLKAVRIEDYKLTLGAPSRFFVETIEGQFLPVLAQALRSVIGPKVQLQYQILVVEKPPVRVAEDKMLGEQMPPRGGFSQTPNEQIMNPFAVVGIKKFNIDPQLNINYTFDNYIEGDCNKLARSVAYAVSERPAQTAFNPFFIYGNSGVGKTHLIQAIGMYIKHKNPDKNVIYLSASRFMRQYMDATKNNQVNNFINFYQMIDVLIIDDIQEIAGKTSTQNVFFQIFNHLKQNDKQIVIAADKKPVEIMDMEERLLSRFKSGVITEIGRPDYDTRVKIIENKMAKDGAQIPEDVVRYIASNVTTNVRELEGSLISLLANATLAHADINIDTARKVVGCMVSKEEHEITPESIFNIICKHYNIDIEALKANTRKHEVVMARQIAMYFCKELTQVSLAAIGQKLGRRKHSTVVYACKSIQNLIDHDKDFERYIKQLETQIRS